MIYTENENLSVCLSAANNITAYLAGENIQVVIGSGAQINLKQAINYIESGRAEIEPLVSQAADFAENAANAADLANNILEEIESGSSDFVKKADAIFYEEIL